MSKHKDVKSWEIYGNSAILEMPQRIAFLSSQKIAAPDVIRCYDWAVEIRDRDDLCVISGFQSALEADVLKYLLRGKVPIVLVLARRMWKKIPSLLAPYVNSGKMLIVAPVSSPRASRETAKKRNQWILQHSTLVVLGTLSPNGMLASLLESSPDVERIRLDNLPMQISQKIDN